MHYPPFTPAHHPLFHVSPALHLHPEVHDA